MDPIETSDLRSHLKQQMSVTWPILGPQKVPRNSQLSEEAVLGALFGR